MKPSQLCLIATLLVTPFAFADEVAVPVGKQAQDKSSMAMPKTGMKADKVEEKFGAPEKKSDPVGKPPISIWEYPQYQVYFEGDRVIHTVLKAEVEAPATTEPAPAPAPVEATPVTPPPAETPAAPAETTTNTPAAPAAESSKPSSGN